MASENGSRADRVAALANRLRLLQVDFADQDDEVRRGFLREELQRALGAVVPAERQAFLEDLQASFPTWDGSSAPPVQVISPDAGKLKDPAFLVDRLVELSATLPETEKRSIAGRLQQAGLIPSDGGGGGTNPSLPSNVGNDLARLLRLSPGDEFVLARAMELLVVLVEVVCSIDQAIWQTWQTKIAPDSQVRRPGVLQQTMGRFIVGSSLVSKAQIGDDVNLLQRLIVALVTAISQSGRFAVEHYRNFSPDDIKALVGSAWGGIEGRCWRKYIELYESHDTDAVDMAIRNAIADYVERLLQGRR